MESWNVFVELTKLFRNSNVDVFCRIIWMKFTLFHGCFSCKMGPTSICISLLTPLNRFAFLHVVHGMYYNGTFHVLLFPSMHYLSLCTIKLKCVQVSCVVMIALNVQ